MQHKHLIFHIKCAYKRSSTPPWRRERRASLKNASEGRVLEFFTCSSVLLPSSSLVNVWMRGWREIRERSFPNRFPWLVRKPKNFLSIFAYFYDVLYEYSSFYDWEAYIINTMHLYRVSFFHLLTIHHIEVF